MSERWQAGARLFLAAVAVVDRDRGRSFRLGRALFWHGYAFDGRFWHLRVLRAAACRLLLICRLLRWSRMGGFGRTCSPKAALVRLSLGRVEDEKGIWWMPWRQEAMKDVARCDKSRGAASRL